MSASLLNKKERTRRGVTLCADVLFALWLFLEVAFAHTAAAQAAMALLMAACVGMAVLNGRATFSFWMPFSFLTILWGLIGALGWALNREAALDMVKTLCVNLLFCFCLFQYLVSRGDFKRILSLYMLAVAAVSLYLLAVCLPMELMNENSRLGMVPDGESFQVIINPNWIGMLAAFSFAMAQFRFMEVFSRHKKAWPWAAGMVFFLAMVLLTKSTKAYGTVFLVFVALILIQWPRKWGWKLLGMFAAALLIFYVVIAKLDVLDHIFFHKLRYTIENLFVPGENDVSLTQRGSLFDIGWQAVCMRPFTGWGLDGFRFLPDAPETYTHNNYLEMLVVGGIPMLLLVYAPYVMGLARGFRGAKNSAAVRLTLLMMLLFLAMDFAQVTYVDRSMLLIPLLLYASVTPFSPAGEAGRSGGVSAYLKNPAKLVQLMSTRGGLPWMPDKLYLTLLYRGCTGKRLHLHPPVTMNEKLQWMKLYDHNPLYPKLVDKLEVRSYVKERGCENNLIPLLGVWDKPEQIDYASLPDRFVLKCTHDSGSARICRDKASFDREAAAGFLSARLKKSYYTAGREWPYKHLKGRIMAEAFIGSPDGTAPDDVKFYCFDGVARAILICTNRREKGADYYFFDRDFQLFPINDKTRDAMGGAPCQKPRRLEEMIILAETLAQGIRQVRVDLYETDAGIYFGEMTLFDQSGFAGDYVDGGDEKMGTFFRMEDSL